MLWNRTTAIECARSIRDWNLIGILTHLSSLVLLHLSHTASVRTGTSYKWAASKLKRKRWRKWEKERVEGNPGFCIIHEIQVIVGTAELVLLCVDTQCAAALHNRREWLQSWEHKHDIVHVERNEWGMPSSIFPLSHYVMRLQVCPSYWIIVCLLVLSPVAPLKPFTVNWVIEPANWFGPKGFLTVSLYQVKKNSGVELDRRFRLNLFLVIAVT